MRLGRPGTTLKNAFWDVAAGKVDDRGWSLADNLNGVDEGGAVGPALPVGAGAAKAATALRRRQKESYGLVSKHELDSDFSNHIHMHDAPEHVWLDEQLHRVCACQRVYVSVLAAP